MSDRQTETAAGEDAMARDALGWSGQSWRLPLWLWLSLAAMMAGALHILLDASVGLFPARGTLAPAVAAALLQVATAGNIRTKTLRAFDEGEMQTLLGKLG
ncbi:MAG: hypothetical protein K0S78_4295 [Thermomicrobiales bacterium]|jgi:hypothetical protein|nr:hypothetical protein [Thermomicrobiales bacterium]MDF3041955.1 hypothetical protein [Thermomicrobiales bacterium]